MRLSVSQKSIVGSGTDTDMLQHRCPSCGCAEEAAVELPIRVMMRLQRTARVISVSMVLLLGMVLAILVLLLFGSPGILRQSKEPENQPTLSEAQIGEQQLDQDLLHASALLTIPSERKPLSTLAEWQHEHGNAHLIGSMTVSNENLIVHTKGLYRLYLQVTFDFSFEKYKEGKCPGCKDICVKDLMSLEISVERLSDSYRSFLPLLVSKDTMSCKHDWSKTMITTGKFELEANTLLRVRFMHSDLVNDHDTLTFFGAELAYALK